MTDDVIPKFVWYKDPNERYYDNVVGGGPIYLRQWRKVKIVKASRTHYHLEGRGVWRYGKYLNRIPKTLGRAYRDFSFSEDEIARLAWMNRWRHELGTQVTGVEDFETLAKIAELIGAAGATLDALHVRQGLQYRVPE